MKCFITFLLISCLFGIVTSIQASEKREPTTALGKKPRAVYKIKKNPTVTQLNAEMTLKSRHAAAFIEWDERAIPKTIFGPISIKGIGTRQEMAKHFFKENKDLFGMNSDLSDIGIIETKKSLHAEHIRFAQTLKGIPVYGSEIVVHFREDGIIQLINNNYDPDIHVETTKSTITGGRALKLAKDDVKPVGELRGDTKTELVIYFKNDAYYLSWKVEVPAEKPLGDWLVFIDATQGTIIDKINILKYDNGTGKVFNPNPIVTSQTATLRDNNDSASAVPTTEYKTVPLQGLDGSGYLKGQYVYAHNKSKRNIALEPTFTYNYNRFDNKFEEVMSYYHIDVAQRYIQSLGFSSVNNRQIEILVNATTQDNSWYSPTTKKITYGSGGVDDAEDADVIWHEYGHAIQDNQAPGFGSTAEGGAMGEGFGDYWATSMHSTLSNYFITLVAIWDATSYDNHNPPYLRSVDTNKVYPTDWVGEVHADGEIWSATLWDIKKLLGRTTTDKLVIQSHFYLTSGANFVDGANAIILADRNLNNGVNENNLRSVFSKRGIPVSIPK